MSKLSRFMYYACISAAWTNFFISCLSIMLGQWGNALFAGLLFLWMLGCALGFNQAIKK